MSNIPVLVPDRPLPPYSYVPKKFPHPISDAEGHSFGQHPKELSYIDQDQWQSCKSYLHGIDLFNHGYYWESHESWEVVWNATGREGEVADFLKGLIKLAAASVKAREGSANGIARHATRGDRLFSKIEPKSPILMGLSLAELRAFAQNLVANADSLVDTSDEPVVRIHEFLLAPK